MAWINGNWEQDDTKNYGYPFRWYIGVYPAFNPKHSSTVWKLHNKVNYGFPYILTVLPTPAPQDANLTVFKIDGMGGGFLDISQTQVLTAPRDVTFDFLADHEIVFYFRTEVPECNI